MRLLSRVERHSDLVGRMAETLGVDLLDAAQAGRIGEGALSSVVYNCMGCDQPQACEGWLAAHIQGADAAPAYCRNKALLDRLASR